jgi:hypothetical protein
MDIAVRAVKIPGKTEAALQPALIIHKMHSQFTASVAKSLFQGINDTTALFPGKNKAVLDHLQAVSVFAKKIVIALLAQYSLDLPNLEVVWNCDRKGDYQFFPFRHPMHPREAVENTVRCIPGYFSAAASAVEPGGF